jgi:2-iminobutanoate/2-iminopropanoate deaminase
MNREIIRSGKVPSNPVLSPAVRFGNLVYTAGMAGRDVATGQLTSDEIQGQARQTLKNITAVLEAAGASLHDVLKATCFLQNLDDRPAFDDVYREFFAVDPPSRTCIQAGRLGPGVLVEVEVVAGISDAVGADDEHDEDGAREKRGLKGLG